MDKPLENQDDQTDAHGVSTEAGARNIKDLDIGPDSGGNTQTSTAPKPTEEGAAAGEDNKDFCFMGWGKKKEREARDDEEKLEEGASSEPQMTADVVTEDFYRMNNARRGKAILINQERFDQKLRIRGLSDRRGTNVDAKAMRWVLADFGFQVEEHKDVNNYGMRRIFKQIAEEDHSDADCFVCVILSHGEEGVVYGTDGTLEIKELSDYFKGDNCPSLIGKPKLFFIQACRGQQTDEGTKVNVVDAKEVDEVDTRVDYSEMIRLPIESDFLFAYSTVPGYYSWRNFANGSWFIQVLSEQMGSIGDKVEILQLLTRVNRLVAQKFESSNDDPYFNKKKQVPCVTSMLTKDVFLTKSPVRKYRPPR